MITNRLSLRENNREYREGQVTNRIKHCKLTHGAFEHQNWGKSPQPSDLGTKTCPVELSATCFGSEKPLLCFFLHS